MPVVHIRANLHLLTTEEGGRKNPIIPGYRSQFHFTGEGPGWGIEFIECDPDPFPPGEDGTVGLTFTMWDTLKPRLMVGTTFEIKEGNRVLGTGVITSVVKGAANTS